MDCEMQASVHDAIILAARGSSACFQVRSSTLDDLPMVHPTDFSSCAFSCACHGCSGVIHNDVFHTQEVRHDFRHLYGAGRDQCHTPQLTALATVTGFFDTYDLGFQVCLWRQSI